jgi:hypothetical protein
MRKKRDDSDKGAVRFGTLARVTNEELKVWHSQSVASISGPPGLMI